MQTIHSVFFRSLAFTIICVLSICVSASSFAKENSINASLDSMVGKWTTFQKGENKPENGQNWQIKWSKKRTHLDYYVETIIKNQVAFNGTGFILYDSESDTYRIYLMMDNGALHESVGKQTDADSYEFKVTTYGVPNTVFPDQLYKLRVTPTEMTGEYTMLTNGAGIDRSPIARITLRRKE